MSSSSGNHLQWIAATLILFAVALVFFITDKKPSLTPHASPELEQARVIGIAIFHYANEHNGAYPTGRSSTEVFQKLIDEKYVTDPDVFYLGSLKVPGKNKATLDTLKPENVCWDLTIPLDAKSEDYLPVVFSTGYRIDYIPGGSATPLFPASEARPSGIAVCYHGMSATWKNGRPDGIIINFINNAFDPAGKKYQQLTPDGTLAP